MRIATKIISGYGILIVVMSALLAYQVFAIYRLESTVRKLSSIDFRSARLSLELMRGRDLVEEFTRKFFVLGDPGYEHQMGEHRASFDRTLAELRSTVRSKKEAEETDRVVQSWSRFLQDLSAHRGDPSQEWVDNLPDGLADHLNKLRDQCLAVHVATLAEIDGEVEKARQTGWRAEMISWSAAGTALILSCIVSFLIVRSISRPLRQLTAGTRAIAEGRFFYRLNTDTHDEFAELARDFNTMTNRLRELDTLKKDFVSHVSHELKSPLASIQETIRILLEQIPGPLTEKQKRFLELNLQSAKRLSAMIANLLDLSRIDAGTMEYDIKNHELRELVETAVAEIEPRAEDKKLKIRVLQPDRPLPIECDMNRVIQVLENVLGNALKFSPIAGSIEVATSITERDASSAPASLRDRIQAHGDAGSTCYTVAVTDHGPGVPDGLKENIFEKFRQIQGTKMTGQGAGLGLAISRTIVEAHGGAIWVEDNAGGGSRFIVLIPAKANKHRAKPVSRPI